MELGRNFGPLFFFLLFFAHVPCIGHKSNAIVLYVSFDCARRDGTERELKKNRCVFSCLLCIKWMNWTPVLS